MKKISMIGGVIILAIGGIVAFSKYGKKAPITSQNPTTKWQYEKTIAEPLKAKTGKENETKLGDIGVNKVAVAVAKGSFDGEMEINLATPEKVPDYDKNEIDVLGSPIEINAGGGNARLNEKALITFKFDPATLKEESDKSKLRIAYYDGSKWEYIKPEKIDTQNGTMVLGTYHFSTYGPASVNNQGVVTAKWIHTTAVGSQLTGNLNGASDQAAEKIMAMTMDKMGIVDKSARDKVREELMKDPSYQEISKFYGTGDPYEAHKKIAMIVGGKIAEHIPKVFFEDAAKRYAAGESPGDIQALAKAAGYAAEGQYKDAAKIIGEQIADKFLITTAGKIAIIVAQSQIDSWKNSEVEAAYMAYKQGSLAFFYGYDVDKGDFDSVWDQMRGIRRQLEIEAIEKENNARIEAGMKGLTDEQKDAIRDSVKNTFKQQFKLREEKEAQFAAEEERLRAIVDAFQKANFFDSTLGPSGLDKGFDYENKLDVLWHFAQKMMKDTKRGEITDKTGLLVDGKLSLEDLVQGTRIYFSGEKGKDEYAKFLQDRFGIMMYPKLADLAGVWKGTSVTTDMEIPDEVPQTVKDELKKEGCEELDFDKIDWEDVKKNAKSGIGKEQEAQFSLSPSGETGGTITGGSGKNAQAMPFVYENGVIRATMTQKGVVATISLTPSVEGSAYKMSGTMRASVVNFFKATMRLSLTKQ
ncbi:hypothetical protein HYV64_00760 [Candidatus Shapirobacteria bacterium]|nr:hypothetical protein [Candidatus Shapirobacteria bacterium]